MINSGRFVRKRRFQGKRKVIALLATLGDRRAVPMETNEAVPLCGIAFRRPTARQSSRSHRKCKSRLRMTAQNQSSEMRPAAIH
jgi:hypothetical protein